MMLHQHLIGASTSLSGSSSSALQSASALNDGALLSHSLQQPKEELKTQFTTREGTYRVMTLAEYSRPNRGAQVQMQQGGAAATSPAGGAPVRVSFLSLSDMNSGSPVNRHPELNEFGETDDFYSDKICFNIGRELYVYHYRGTHTAADLSRPIDKRVYKGTYPTTHNFNQESAKPNGCSLIIGFSTGQLQLIDPLNKDYQASRLFNEERLVDKTAVTCLRWIPGQPHLFLAAYSSGNMYVYNEELQCPQAPPTYQTFKQGEKFTVYTCKTKSSKNPLYRWQVGDGAINQFAFSGPDAKFLATVGHDGYLRIFNYHQMELLSVMKSYFGGLLTLSWSPDAKLIATGGEDDLLTVYSVADKRVVCRGQGHKSWISQVSFDPYCCTTDNDVELNGFGGTSSGNEDINDVDTKERASTDCASASNVVPILASTSSVGDVNSMTPVMRAHARRNAPLAAASTLSRCSFASFGTINGTGQAGAGVCYRIGSVGHDTQLCLWDITEDMLKPANVQRHRNSTIIAPMLGLEIQTSSPGGRLEILAEASPGGAGASTSSDPSPSSVNTTATSSKEQKPEKKKKSFRFHRRGFTLGRLNVGGSSSGNSLVNAVANSTNGGAHSFGTGDRRRNDASTSSSPVNALGDNERLLGTKMCPRIEDVPVIEPLMCKRIAHERLTVLEFRRDCVVTACQEGFICTWARPGKSPTALAKQRELLNMNSPGTISPETVARGTDNRFVDHRDRDLFSASDGHGVSTMVAPPRSASAYSAGITTSLSGNDGFGSGARSPINNYGGGMTHSSTGYRTGHSALTTSTSGYNWNAL